MFAQQQEEPPFIHTLQALRSAYATEAKDVCQVSNYLAELRGGSIKERSGLTPWDKVAQASMVISLMRRELGKRDRDVIDLLYTVPIGTLANKKELLAKEISFAIYEESKNQDRWYICDIVREWAGGGIKARHHDDKWWSKKIGVNDRTLRKWRLGRADRGTVGIMGELDKKHTEAIGKVASVFVEKGIVKYE